MDQIDVVTTAIRRPEILEMAYRSYFNGGIIGLPSVRIILNIDPIGEGSLDKLVNIAKRYSDDVIVNAPKEGNFANAVNWCWSQVQSEFFLHLEDDWLLAKPIRFSEWLSCLETENCLQAVLVRKRRRLDLSPYSFRANLARRIVIEKVGLIPASNNPEKYAKTILPNDCSIDFGPDRELFDMGRKWAKSSQIRKSSNSNNLEIDAATLRRGWFSGRNSGLFGKLDYWRSKLIWNYVLSRYEGTAQGKKAI